MRLNCGAPGGAWALPLRHGIGHETICHRVRPTWPTAQDRGCKCRIGRSFCLRGSWVCRPRLGAGRTTSAPLGRSRGGGVGNVHTPRPSVPCHRLRCEPRGGGCGSWSQPQATCGLSELERHPASRSRGAGAARAGSAPAAVTAAAGRVPGGTGPGFGRRWGGRIPWGYCR